MHQSPKIFNQLLMQKLLEFYLKRGAVDPCIFHWVKGGKKEVSLIVGVYVDEFFVTSKSDECISLREYLGSSFPTKNLGCL